MADLIRVKHVTHRLGERVRACLRGELNSCGSSGSDYDAAIPDGEPSCFSGLLQAFPDTSDDDPCHGEDSEPESSSSGMDPACCADSAIATLMDLLEPLPSAFGFILEVDSAVRMAAQLNGPALRRVVMARLRERGHNAGLCKARWEGGAGLIAGRYEYIDVVFAENGLEERRYIVDMGFAAEFGVARATEGYERMAAALPSTVVARPEDVRAVVGIMADAARRSLKSRGMSVPPWRKKKYMMAKWLGAYRRTVNAFPAAVGRIAEARCRVDGFWRAEP